MSLIAQFSLGGIWDAIWPYLVIFAGFSVVIFVHELGHFAAAKWAGVRVERFAIGFFSEVVGFTRGETRYSFNILPLGGYVKMLGQEDFEDKAGELVVKSDPRSFSNKSVFKRMVIVSAGVVMNLVFTAFLFVIVFMSGTEEMSTTVGQVVHGSPAAVAGLQPGDRIKRINDQEIREYSEIRMAVMLAKPHTPLEFEVERRGATVKLDVRPEPNEQLDLLQVGIAPAQTNEVLFVAGEMADADDPDQLQAGDLIQSIEGKPLAEVSGGTRQMLRSAAGIPVKVMVERPDPKNPDAPPETRETLVYSEMVLYQTDPFRKENSRSILGLIPPVRLSDVNPRGRAAVAGIKDGDVVLKFGPHILPTEQEINETIAAAKVEPSADDARSWRRRLYNYFTWNSEVDIPVYVTRRGNDRPMYRMLTPKVDDKGKPHGGFLAIGVAFDVPQIAGVEPLAHGKPTPAAEAGIPTGSQIVQVAGVEIGNWGEIVEQLRLAAGTDVEIAYENRSGPRRTATMSVPESLRTKLGLTTLATIVSIDDSRRVRIDIEGGGARDVSVVNPWAQYELLKQAVERSGGSSAMVSVRYVERPGEDVKEASVEITLASIDPWLGRVRFEPIVLLRPKLQTLKASGPIDALNIGLKKTWYFVLTVYTTLERMIVSRTVGVKHVSGPVGIVKIGGDVARAGFIKILFFLAVISANLAVINFLPLPVVDGGLMVFLLIEKIKGSPVSLKVQVATQVIGLCLIGAAFLFVTFHDVLKLAGG